MLSPQSSPSSWRSSSPRSSTGRSRAGGRSSPGALRSRTHACASSGGWYFGDRPARHRAGAEPVRGGQTNRHRAARVVRGPRPGRRLRRSPDAGKRGRRDPARHHAADPDRRPGDVRGRDGTVEDVRLTYTFIRKANATRVIVPNERLAQSTIENHTIVDPRVRVEVEIWLPPHADASRALAVLGEDPDLDVEILPSGEGRHQADGRHIGETARDRGDVAMRSARPPSKSSG